MPANKCRLSYVNSIKIKAKVGKIYFRLIDEYNYRVTRREIIQKIKSDVNILQYRGMAMSNF